VSPKLQSAAAITYTKVRFETMDVMFFCTSSYKTAAYQAVITPYKTEDNCFHLFELTSNQNRDMQQHQLNYPTFKTSFASLSQV
jgi:hypothetical protein